MYGQTNCFVLPEGQYGAFEFKNDEVLIVSERAALGLAHQDMALEWGKVRCLLPLMGSDLLGLALKAPNSVYERVYTLPLMTISMGKVALRHANQLPSFIHHEIYCITYIHTCILSFMYMCKSSFLIQSYNIHTYIH